jgi:hypothetical protein
MRALSVLSLKKNGLLTKEAGKALAQALAGNSILTELDVSYQATGYTRDDGPGFAQELAVGIKDNGTMTSLNLASNNLGWYGRRGRFAKYDTSGKPYSLATSADSAC